MANSFTSAGADTIRFNIPTTAPNCNANTGVCTILPNLQMTSSQALPTITEQLTINGYTQRPCSSNPAPCSRANSSAVGTNAVLLIQLNGANATSSAGLRIHASNVVVKGLVINRFGTGIQIGTRDATGNKIEGNFVGTNAAGTLGLGNLFQGVGVNGAHNTVGGSARAARNLISGNGDAGADITGSGNQVLGNLMGTDRTGTEPLGNDGDGLNLFQTGNTVGGDFVPSANVIAFNAKNGVAVTNFPQVVRHSILDNSIFSNGGQGIDLGEDGRTTNDVGDADTGPNNLQNFPVLTSAQTEGTTTTINGRLNSTPSTTFVVRFFSNPSSDNEGKTYIGSMSVTINASGNTGAFTFTPGQRVALGQTITATATDPAGNTSEFSATREVKGLAP
jgi:hypothetical protein